MKDHIVLNRHKIVFKGNKDDCQKYIIDNHVDHGYKNHNVISITLSNGAKIHTVKFMKCRDLSYRFIYFDFFWLNNDTRFPNMEEYPEWYMRAWEEE